MQNWTTFKSFEKSRFERGITFSRELEIACRFQHWFSYLKNYILSHSLIKKFKMTILPLGSIRLKSALKRELNLIFLQLLIFCFWYYMKDPSWGKYHFIKSFWHEFYKNQKGVVITLNSNCKTSALSDLEVYFPSSSFLLSLAL